MLEFRDARGEGFGGIAWLYRTRELNDDRAVVVLFANQMDRAAGFRLTGGEDGLVYPPPVHASTAEFRQEGRVDVQDAAGQLGDDFRRDFSQESGEADDVPAVFPCERENTSGVLGAFGIDHGDGQAEGYGATHGGSIGLRADDPANGGVDLPATARGGQRGHVAAGASWADEDGDSGRIVHGPGFYPRLEMRVKTREIDLVKLGVETGRNFSRR